MVANQNVFCPFDDGPQWKINCGIIYEFSMKDAAMQLETPQCDVSTIKILFHRCFTQQL